MGSPGKRVSEGTHRQVPLLTVAEVATHLGMSRKAIYGWVERGVLPHFKVGSCVRFAPQELAEWLRARRRHAR